MVRIEVNRGSSHLVLDGGTGTGEWLDHPHVEVFANIANTVTLITEEYEDGPGLTLTPAEARALSGLLLTAAVCAERRPAGV